MRTKVCGCEHHRFTLINVWFVTDKILCECVSLFLISDNKLERLINAHNVCELLSVSVFKCGRFVPGFQATSRRNRKLASSGTRERKGGQN